MKTYAVGVKALRDNLSRYLREVRGGARVYVLDRDEVIAELHEPETPYFPPANTTLAEEMEVDGKLISPRGKRIECKPSPVRLPKGTSARILNADRSDADEPLR